MFRESCRRFFDKEVVPFHMKWEEEGIVPRALWRKAGGQGLLGMTMPEEYGGAGADFLYNTILIEEQGRALASGPAFSLHNDIVVPYLLHYGTEEQKKKWIPKACSGELITAIAMTEPGTGSDLQGGQDQRRDGRRPLGDQRLEDLHQQRPARRPGDRGRQDRSQARRQGHLADRRRDRHAGLQARPQPGEDRHEGAGHLGAVLRRCARAGRQPAGRRHRHGLRPADAAAAAGAAGDRHPGDRRHRGRARPHRGLRQGAQGVRQADRRFPEHPLQAGRDQDQGARRPGLRRRLRGAAPRGQARCRHRRHGQVLDDRAAVRGHRPVPAVLRRLRLHVGVPHRAACTPTRACRRSTAAPTRS